MVSQILEVNNAAIRHIWLFKRTCEGSMLAKDTVMCIDGFVGCLQELVFWHWLRDSRSRLRAMALMMVICRPRLKSCVGVHFHALKGVVVGYNEVEVDGWCFHCRYGRDGDVDRPSG